MKTTREAPRGYRRIPEHYSRSDHTAPISAIFADLSPLLPLYSQIDVGPHGCASGMGLYPNPLEKTTTPRHFSPFPFIRVPFTTPSRPFPVPDPGPRRCVKTTHRAPRRYKRKPGSCSNNDRASPFFSIFAHLSAFQLRRGRISALIWALTHL